MIKKFIVSFLCVVFIAGVIFSGVCLLYFAIPSQTAMNSISLPSTVEDPEETESSSTEDEEESGDTYLADVHQSLTLREGPSSDSDAIASMTPMTHLRVIEFVEDTDYALVEVQTGEYESYRGYVNSEYITQLGEPTIRIGTEE